MCQDIGKLKSSGVLLDLFATSRPHSRALGSLDWEECVTVASQVERKSLAVERLKLAG